MSIINTILKRINKCKVDRLVQKSIDDVEYIWLNHNSDTLVIVFSAIGSGRFNYLRTLKNCSFDQLYIRDSWAGGVSYYWYEHKSNNPEIYTSNLIKDILEKKAYKSIITVGSSKGGTAAIYYGLKFYADLVFSGACQYRVGDYLSRHQIKEHPDYWKAVVGEVLSVEWVKILDEKVARMIDERNRCKTIIKLLYSTNEHTYPEHIQPLIEKLDNNYIKHEDQIESFPSHSMVGEFFKEALKEFFF